MTGKASGVGKLEDGACGGWQWISRDARRLALGHSAAMLLSATDCEDDRDIDDPFHKMASSTGNHASKRYALAPFASHSSC